MSRAFFEEVTDALVGFLPPPLARFSSRASARNLKIWYGDEHREHYEVQFLPASVLADGVPGVVLELGFHAEHPDASRNDALVARLLDGSPGWRRRLGRKAESGPFPGAPRRAWRRVSEVWEGPNLDTPEAATEAADRLARYIATLEPGRQG